MDDTPETAASLERACREAAAGGVLHGAVVASGTAAGLELLWAGGMAAAGQPMRTDSIFDVASVTKAVATATACGICIDRGLLDPDAPARLYLPELGQLPHHPIRVRDLACHCSGYDNRKFDALPPDRMLAAIAQTPPQRPPGTSHVYACRNYILLGLIAEAVAQTPLARICRDGIFDPLAMRDTAFGPIDAKLERVVPSETDAGIISDPQARNAPRPVGNAGLFSTAADLAVFCRMILGGGRLGDARVLGEQAIAWLTRPINPPGMPAWSFGWDMQPCGECLHRPARVSPSAIGHSGWTGQSVWIDPAAGSFAIVLTNRTYRPQCGDNYQASKRLRARLADIALAALAHGEILR